MLLRQQTGIVLTCDYLNLGHSEDFWGRDEPGHDTLPRLGEQGQRKGVRQA